jgi:small-conductance mechanosensitive channel
MNLIYILAIILCFIIADVILRYSDVKDSNIKAFDTIGIIVIGAFSLVITKNTALIAFLGSLLLSVSWAFRDLLSNLVSTLFLHLYPPYKPNDVLTIGTDAGLLFTKIGLFRSVLTDGNGDVYLVPNSILFNGLVSVK